MLHTIYRKKHFKVHTHTQSGKQNNPLKSFFPQTPHLPLFADKRNPTNTIKQPVGVSVLK